MTQPGKASHCQRSSSDLTQRWGMGSWVSRLNFGITMWCLYFNSFIIVVCSPKEPWDLECTLYAAMLNPYFRTIIAVTTRSRLVLFKQTQWPWFSGHVYSSFEFSVSQATISLWTNLHLRLSSFLVPPNHYCFLCLSPTQILCPFPAPLPNCLAACQL